jgi:uncharacterized membrane protein YkvI
MTVVVVALIGNIDLLFNKEVPILILATKALPIYGSIFALVIFMGIYTTVTPLIWTVCRRFFEERTESFNLLSISLTLICLLGGNLLPFWSTNKSNLSINWLCWVNPYYLSNSQGFEFSKKN